MEMNCLLNLYLPSGFFQADHRSIFFDNINHLQVLAFYFLCSSAAHERTETRAICHLKKCRRTIENVDIIFVVACKVIFR